MALIQVRDLPDHLYRQLVEQARRERRSMSQQAVAVLARGLDADLNAKSRRQRLLRSIQTTGLSPAAKLTDPARLIREDRRR